MRTCSRSALLKYPETTRDCALASSLMTSLQSKPKHV